MSEMRWECADCGTRRVDDERCEHCGSVRVVLVSVAESATGIKWDDAFAALTESSPESGPC